MNYTVKSAVTIPVTSAMSGDRDVAGCRHPGRYRMFQPQAQLNNLDQTPEVATYMEQSKENPRHPGFAEGIP